MKLTIMKYTLVLLVLPLMLMLTVGCNDLVGPEDKWPDIISWTHTENFDVVVDILQPYGIPQLTVPDRTVEVTTQIRSYHALQEYTIRIVLTGITETITMYENNLPAASQCFFIPYSEVHYEDSVIGSYLIGSGQPPQGVSEFLFYYDPGWFPTAVGDWIRLGTDTETGATYIASVTERYQFHYRVIFEDPDGRTDTYDYCIMSELKVSDSDN